MIEEPIHVTDAAFLKDSDRKYFTSDCRFLGAMVWPLPNGRPDPG